MNKEEEKIEYILRQPVEGETPDRIWKQSLIESMEKRMTRKKWFARPSVYIGIGSIASAVALAGVFLTQTTSNNFYQEEQLVSYTPWAIASDWEKEHVRYYAAEGFSFPETLSHGEKSYGSIDDILADLNANPILPHLSADFPDDVFIEYELYGYEIRQSGQSLSTETQLVFFARLRDQKKIKEQLRGTGLYKEIIKEPEIFVDVSEKRKQMLLEIEQYTEHYSQ